ncbi:polysaccharide deacetylase [Fictibacillus aquaticus]|uniref:Polysaccharide deacetylase n=2 Tax=Fictibacillus aquaticus TaxID=2021314 RepID=A0A235F948_9BACL|nr:polysaccharide deacetylase [Fictibacillus aquaticus]
MVSTADLADIKIDNSDSTATNSATENSSSNEKEKDLVQHIEEETSKSALSIQALVEKYTPITPQQWGENVTGVKTQLDTADKVIALTLDACGGVYGSGYDKDLIEFLKQHKIPATLFVNSRWIDKNEEAFLSLSQDPLFEIENHGTEHKPLSVSGKSAYSVQGTATVEEAIQEIVENEQKIEKLTGKAPKFFRSGTAHYDEVAVQIAEELGETAVNYNLLGDAGATFSSEQVKAALLAAQPGSIALLHMNQPESGTAEGIMQAVPLLLDQGFRFVKLEDHKLK